MGGDRDGLQVGLLGVEPVVARVHAALVQAQGDVARATPILRELSVSMADTLLPIAGLYDHVEIQGEAAMADGHGHCGGCRRAWRSLTGTQK